MSILPIGIGIGEYLEEDGSITKGESAINLVILLLLGTALILIWLGIKDKVVPVKLGGQNITIYQGDAEKKVNWFDVESIQQQFFIQPPIYRLKIKDKAGYYLFVTQPYSIQLPFFTMDISGMGGLIKKKKKELGI